MWFRKPSERRVESFLRQQEGQPFSYDHVGASRGAAPAGFRLDQNRVCLGQGEQAFASACAALRAWQMFPPAWTQVLPRDAPVEAGQVVAIVARGCGLWWLNSCRIVYVIDEPRAFGFAYGTLPAHVECGEERFLIQWDEDDRVWYDLRAFSRPRHPLARLASPIARRLQRRFVRDSQATMQRLLATGCTAA